MGVRSRTGARRAAGAAAVAVLLASAGCTRTSCDFDDCPDVPGAQSGHVVGRDPAGVVRWTTTVADLLSEAPFVSNGHVVLVGCHATHVVDVASGAVTSPHEVEQVLGVVDGYAVGVPSEGDAVVAAEHLTGGPGSWSWVVAPPDPRANEGYRTSAVVTADGLVGVRGQDVVAWTLRDGRWTTAEVRLPVGSWRAERLAAVDDTHVVVPGSDGSVLGVDLGTGSVTWRSMPTRPDAPAGVAVHVEGSRVVAEVWYPRTTAPAVSGEAVWVTETWSLDPRSGAVVTPRTTRTGTRPGHTDSRPSSSLRDPASGWSVTQQLSEQLHGGCF